MHLRKTSLTFSRWSILRRTSTSRKNSNNGLPCNAWVFHTFGLPEIPLSDAIATTQCRPGHWLSNSCEGQWRKALINSERALIQHHNNTTTRDHKSTIWAHPNETTSTVPHAFTIASNTSGESAAVSRATSGARDQTRTNGNETEVRSTGAPSFRRSPAKPRNPASTRCGNASPERLSIDRRDRRGND